MTAPGATSDRVSLAVGYASPAAFARAFSDAHLPAPSNIARQVRDLL
jgi:transcriptional regulator GlxA family with amidase domain